MKFLADENVEKPIIDVLRAQGHDVTWIMESASATDDENVLQIAQKENRILLTNDKDFGEHVFLQKKLSSGIILFRFENEDAFEKAAFVQKLLTEYLERLPGRFTVISETKIRFRSLPEN